MSIVAGVDEAGRGPLAGPVVVAAVILPDGFSTERLADSKVLSAKDREELEVEILESCTYAIEFGSVEEIDRINILWATMEAMTRAIDRLAVRPAKALIDGNRLPKVLSCEGEAIVDGDAKVACISAASILAKTARDRYMKLMAQEFPEYGFERHFGYATPEHIRALEEFGPCPIHRRGFKRCQSQLTFAFE